MSEECEQENCNKKSEFIFKAKIGKKYIELKLCSDHFQEVVNVYNECFNLENSIMSESSLKKDWLSAEEEEAWKDL